MPYFNPTITPIGLSCKHREACLEREVDLSLKLDVDGLEEKKTYTGLQQENTIKQDFHVHHNKIRSG